MVTESKLFGVDQQQQELYDAFQRCVDIDVDIDSHNKQAEAEVCIISGSSGSGKTALAQTLQEHSEYTVIGKCDQFQQGSEPFGPFITALSRLTDEIFQNQKNDDGEDDDDVEIVQFFKSRAQQALPDDTEIHLLIDTIPLLARFFPTSSTSANRQNNRTALSATTAAQRSTTFENPTIQVICKFLQSICSPDHPIVLIIDDIQWIDSSSLELFANLVASQKEMAGLMLLATCRDDEVTEDDAFHTTVKNLKEKKDVLITNVHLESLSVGTISKLVVDRFPTLAGQNLEALSTVLQTHTKGNAFFATQILQRLKKSGWKPPSGRNAHGGKGEEWDSVNERSMIDHMTALDCHALVDIVVADTANESPFMKEVMTTASCLGSDFVTSHLVAVTSESITNEDINTALLCMKEKQFIRLRLGGEGWSWAHDKFQKAAYLLIGRKEREMFHLNIGRRLHSALSEEELGQYLFIVASQFCLSLKKLDEDETESVAELMLQAGERSGQSSSFGKAASYIAIGTSLLKEDNWESQYELSVKLYNAAATMECCRGNYAEADKLVTVILRQTRSIRDRLSAIETKMFYLAAKEEHHQAICLALDVMKQLGEKFPKKPGMHHMIYETMGTMWQLSKRTVDDILSMPPMTDWKKLAILRMLQAVFLSSSRANELLTPVIVCRSIKLTLKYGLSGLAAYNFATMCLILTHPLGYLEDADKCARISKGIMEKCGVDDFMRCRIDLVLEGLCFSLKAPIRDTLEPYKRASSVGLVTGDIDSACMCLRSNSFTMLFCGERLDTIASVTRRNARSFHAWGQPCHETCEANLQQVLENLTSVKKKDGAADDDDDDDPCTFTGTYMEEEDWIEKAIHGNDQYRLLLFRLFKIFVALYLRQHEVAKEMIGLIFKDQLYIVQGVLIYEIYFFDAYIDVVLAREKNSSSNGDGGTRKNNKKGGGAGKAKKYKASLKKLQRYGKDASANINNKIWLIEAEVEVLLKHGKKKSSKNAISKFHQSIVEAKQQGLIHEEALAYERCAIAMLEWGDVTEALEYFGRAKHLYEQWGSSVKVKQLVSYVKENSGVTLP